MLGFTGRFYHAIDEKGRVSIPSSFRDVLTSKYGNLRLMLATDFDRCIAAYPIPEWEKIEENARKLPPLLRETKAFMRHFIASSVECEIDKQGRILIPQTHRAYAGINGEAVLLGLAYKIEVWDINEFKKVSDGIDPDKIATVVTEYGGVL